MITIFALINRQIWRMVVILGYQSRSLSFFSRGVTHFLVLTYPTFGRIVLITNYFLHPDIIPELSIKSNSLAVFSVFTIESAALESLNVVISTTFFSRIRALITLARGIK